MFAICKIRARLFKSVSIKCGAVTHAIRNKDLCCNILTDGSVKNEKKKKKRP